MSDLAGQESGGEIRSWHVRGMDCPSCVSKVEGAVSGLAGVGEVSVNLMAERLTVRLGPKADSSSIPAAVAALGYKAFPETPPPAVSARTDDGGGPRQYEQRIGEANHTQAYSAKEDDPGVPWWRTGKAKLVWLLGVLVAAAWIGSRLFAAEADWIFVAATLVAVVPFGRRALALARAGSPFSIEMLMCVAALGAVAIGAAEEAAIVVLLFAIGELLENVAAGQARAGIRALANLMPRTARVEREGGLAELPADSLRPGNVVQVRPGDRIPCDGLILDGQSSVDESPVTGESVPVERGPGEMVVAASINTAALLRVRVTATAADNTISRIVRMVEEATASRAPTQRFIEQFSEYWTPGAMAVSALVILLPPLAFGADWATWIYRGLSVLLIACPCALVISVPAAVASGLSVGARRGLLIKGGAALERIGSAVTIAFDKTGTLTAGHPRVTDILPAPGTEATTLLSLAAGVEAGSAHPLARAVLEAAAARGVQPSPATEASAVPGKAATARIGERLIAVGSPRYAEEQGAVLPDRDAVARLETEGKTVVAVLADRQPVGVLALRDEPREDAAAAIAALRAMGLSSVMLTGDNQHTGSAIAANLGMEVRARLLPEQKLREIEALKARGLVVMVGDGINDAPALAAASVGVAMGGGTAVALETADAALLRERVTGVAELVALSRATLANVKQNMAIAIGLKLVFLVTTLPGVTGLWMAILADTGATVLVTINALQLLRWRSPLADMPDRAMSHYPAAGLAPTSRVPKVWRRKKGADRSRPGRGDELHSLALGGLFFYSRIMESFEAAVAFGALSQETRLDLMRLLIAEGASGLPAGEIGARLGVPSSTLSFHLSALERAGLTQSTRQGRQIVHAVRVAGLRRLLGFLTETCCAGRPELCGDIARLLPPFPDEDQGMTPAFNVLFLCTHNSARSLMAEAILAKVGGARFQAYSAGSTPISEPNSDVLAKLHALGHDTTVLRSKSWNEFTGPSAPRMDFIITLCDTLHGQVCPDFGPVAVTAAWPLPDPAKFTGSPVERATLLNELYASLRRRIEIFTVLPFASLDRMAMKARLDEIGGGGVPVPAGVR